MIDVKKIFTLAVVGLSLGACAPSPDSSQLVPPPSQFASDPVDEEKDSGKVFDMNGDDKVTAGEAAGGVIGVAVVLAICPFCVLGM